MTKGKTFVQLSEQERCKLEVLLQQGHCVSRIAQVLGRSVSTLSREVRRNKTPGGYRAAHAHSLCLRRHRLKAKHLVFDEAMKRFIKESLIGSRSSPELIAVAGKALRNDFICSEWIYQWIWKMKFSQRAADRPYQGLFKYLRHASRKRKRGNKRKLRGHIVGRVWIDQRPQPANQRARKGDLECDLMLGKNRKPGLLVVLDRKTRKVWIRHLKSKDSAYVIQKVRRVAQNCRAQTITFDNDQSFAVHYQLHRLGMQTFFTHPYSSQEKGSVENRIGLIRMFFPKHTDFSLVSPQQVKTVETLINNRPLRMFNYKTPNELYI